VTVVTKVARVSWSNVGNVEKPGRYMFKFGWVTITNEDLAIWSQFPDATFALYEVRESETGNDYRLGSVNLNATTFARAAAADDLPPNEMTGNAANAWFVEHDPESDAFQYPAKKDAAD
jgi:hypothetical protein